MSWLGQSCDQDSAMSDTTATVVYGVSTGLLRIQVLVWDSKSENVRARHRKRRAGAGRLSAASRLLCPLVYCHVDGNRPNKELALPQITLAMDATRSMPVARVFS